MSDRRFLRDRSTGRNHCDRPARAAQTKAQKP